MDRRMVSSRLGHSVNPDHLFTLFDTLPNAYFFAKDRQSRFVYLNQLVWQGLGAGSEAEALGKTDADFHPPAMATAYMEEDRRVMQAGEPLRNRIWLVHNLHYRLPQWFVSTKVPLATEQGETVGIAGVMHPIESTQLRARYFQDLDPAIQYIEKHFEENISMDEVAARIPCSRTQLNRQFQNLLHMTPTAFLMAQRIQAARRLLVSSDAQVAEIAVAVGFCDQSHLTRRFRLVTGETPAAFRRKFQKSSGK